MPNQNHPDVFPSLESFGPRVSQLRVFGGVVIVLAITAIPFMFKKVRDKENAVANMRDSVNDAKDQARNARLQGPKRAS